MVAAARKPLVVANNVSGDVANTDVLTAPIGGVPTNIVLVASVANNALTIAVKGVDGNDPSPASPAFVPFKSAGGFAYATITAPLSVTVPSGATLGTASGVAARIWIVALLASGAASLGVKVCTDGASRIYPLGQTQPQSATALSASATAAGTLYAAAAATGLITVLGCLEGTQATAGTWATAPTPRRWQAGDKLPGDIEQVVTAASGTSNNNNTNAYNTNGLFQGIGASITPTSSLNAVRVRTSGGLMANPGNNSIAGIRLTRGSTGLTLAEAGEYFFANGSSWGSSSGMQVSPSLEALDFPATTSPTSYGTQLKNGDNASNITYPNGGTARISIEEVVV